MSITQVGSDSKAPRSPGATPPAERMVLVVDDEPMVLEVTGDMLAVLGFSALLCASGQQAIELFERRHPQIDLAIIDLTMPDMDGAETIRRLRQIDPSLKVILSSGYGRERLAVDILGPECDAFIQKPYSLDALSSKIKDTLSACKR